MAYVQVTAAQLRAQFYEQVSGNTAFWRTDEVNRLLKESFRFYNCLTGYWRDTITLGTTTSGQTWYTVPQTLTYILRVEVNQRPLDSTTLWDLDYGRPGWEDETVATGAFPTMFAPAGTNLFALWPTPSSSTDPLVVEGVVPAPDPTAVPFVNIGQADLEAILDYAEHLAQFKEGGEEFDASQLWFQDFLKDAASRNSLLAHNSRWRGFMGLTDKPKRPLRDTPEKVGPR